MSSEATFLQIVLARASMADSTEASSSEINAYPEKVLADEPVRVPDSTAEVVDEQLMEQLRAGSRDGLARLFPKHTRAVRNVAYRILRAESAADALVQDVFLFLFQKATVFDAKKG